MDRVEPTDYCLSDEPLAVAATIGEAVVDRRQAPIGSGFGAFTTAAEVLAGRDVRGKLAIVTGGYSGLGLETTRALAAAGADVVIGARRPAAAREAVAGIAGVAVDALDLSDLDSVFAFV